MLKSTASPSARNRDTCKTLGRGVAPARQNTVPGTPLTNPPTQLSTVGGLPPTDEIQSPTEETLDPDRRSPSKAVEGRRRPSKILPPIVEIPAPTVEIPALTVEIPGISSKKQDTVEE